MNKKYDFIVKKRKERYTFEAIGNMLGVSRQRVQQILIGYKSVYKIIEKKCEFCNKIIPFIKGEKRGNKYCQEHSTWKMGLQGRDCIRELIRIRDNHTCQQCGKKWIEGTRRFDVHHLDEEFEGWDNIKGKKGLYENDKKNFDRMITLCHKCHLNLPGVKYKMTLKGRK